MRGKGFNRIAGLGEVTTIDYEASRRGELIGMISSSRTRWKKLCVSMMGKVTSESRMRLN